MKKEDLARELARETQTSDAQARDNIDILVHRILKSLREGRPVKLPGMGRLVSKRASKS
jgi:nucleoid DNA-binding protein